MPAPAADSNLLFAVLAMQNELVARDDLLAAMNAWGLEKHRPLGDILVERGALLPEDRALLDGLIARQLNRHGSAERSLAAVPVSSWLKDEIKSLCHPELEASLVHLGAARDAAGDPNTTRSFTATEAGARYRILRPHARGGLGKVFVAEDAELHRQVALKQMQAQHAGSDASRGRFVLEAEITGGLEHPGIVPVYGLGTYADGRPFYAMRFIKGDNLKEAIARYHGTSKPRDESSNPASHDAKILAFRQLLGRFIDVCNAVAYAHSRGVLHRDLKPGNIMLGKFGETLVVDWGLAKVVGRAQSRERPGEASLEAPLTPASGSGVAETLAGTAIGTPAYMSPEQAAGRLDQLSGASDVYSLGATLYALLTGKAPVEDKDVAATLKRVREGNVPRPRQVAPQVDRALEAVCLQAMALKPADRYPSPRNLADDLERWLADKPVSAWPEPIVVRAKRWARQHQTLVTSSAASLFIALVGLTAGLLWYQDQQAEAERKGALAEAAIASALDQADKPRQELHAILAKRGGVFGLLNEPARWAAYIETADTRVAGRPGHAPQRRIRCRSGARHACHRPSGVAPARRVGPSAGDEAGKNPHGPFGNCGGRIQLSRRRRAVSGRICAGGCGIAQGPGCRGRRAPGRVAHQGAIVGGAR